jgi:hypothetical protein
MDSHLIDIAKATVQSGHSECSRQYFLKKLDDEAEARRQPGQTFHQSYARLCESPDGLLLLKASRVARSKMDDQTAEIRKALHPDRRDDTASQRLAACAVALQESCPSISNREACEIVAKKKPGAICACGARAGR